MSQSSDKLPFSININGGDPSSSLGGENSSSEYKEYIIQNNISLQQQNQHLTQKNQELSKELSEKALERARSKFSWETIAKKLEKVYFKEIEIFKHANN